MQLLIRISFPNFAFEFLFRIFRSLTPPPANAAGHVTRSTARTERAHHRRQTGTRRWALGTKCWLCWCLGAWCLGAWCLGSWCLGAWCLGAWCLMPGGVHGVPARAGPAAPPLLRHQRVWGLGNERFAGKGGTNHTTARSRARARRRARKALPGIKKFEFWERLGFGKVWG